MKIQIQNKYFELSFLKCFRMMDWREEFELLSSMLLKPGESCQIIGEKPCPIIKVIYNEFDLTFQLHQNYPETKPTIAMNSNVLDRKVCDEILEILSHEAVYLPWRSYAVSIKSICL